MVANWRRKFPDRRKSIRIVPRENVNRINLVIPKGQFDHLRLSSIFFTFYGYFTIAVDAKVSQTIIF